MFIPFTPHSVCLKSELFTELTKQDILGKNITCTHFPVIAMDIKTNKENVIDKEKFDEDDEDDVPYKEIEVAEIMLLIGIQNYGYYWVDQNETIFFVP